MGRNKIKIEKIKNERIRQVTFYKRKKGLLKKAMELSLLCEVKVFLCIVDKNEKMMVFSSEKDINDFKTTYIDQISTARELFTHDDYKEIFIEDKADFSKIENESDQDESLEEDPKIRKSKKNSKFYKKNSKLEEKVSSNLSSYKDQSEESGISKIKEKLSLKVKIPADKQSVEAEKKKNLEKDMKNLSKLKELKNATDPGNSMIGNNTTYISESSILPNNFNNVTTNTQLKPKVGLKIDTGKNKNIPSSITKNNNFNEPQQVNRANTPSRSAFSPTISQIGDSGSKNMNLSNFFGNNQIPQPMSNPFMVGSETFLNSHKRYRDDNYLNFSPNLTAGSLKPLTPLYNNISPNKQNIFMFNNANTNSLTPTPIQKKSNYFMNTPRQENAFFEYPPTSNNDVSKDQNTINNLNSSKTEMTQTQNPPNFNNNSTVALNPPVQNNNNSKNYSNVSNVNIGIPNIVLVSPACNPNLGFYTWVMQGSPHQPNTTNTKDTKQRKYKLKAKFVEETDSDQS